MLEYSVALLNVWWSKGDKNIRFFESVEEQSTYFDKLVGGQTSPLTNFNMGNNIETAITYIDTTNKSIEQLVTSNYCVIYKKENGTIIDRRYFFAYPSQDSGRQMRVLLSLDDIQTNYVKYKKSIAPCNIKRACLNRFKKIENNKVKFNDELTNDNHLFEEEEISNLPKRVIERELLSIHPDTSSSGVLNDWLSENVLGWQYYYCDPTHAFKLYNYDNGSLVESSGDLPSYYSLYDTNKTNIGGATGILCVPKYKSDKQIICVIDDVRIEVNEGAFRSFTLSNEDFSFIYSNKYSLTPPFRRHYYENCSIDENGNLIINLTQDGIYLIPSPDTKMVVSFASGTNGRGFFHVFKQSINLNYERSFNINKQFDFNIGEIINSKKDYKFNPKMLSSKYLELKISNGSGSKFSYNLQKLGTNNLTCKYVEALTPDITRSFFWIENGQYDNKNAKAYLGLIDSVDNTLMQSNDQLSQFLAQNKNFHQQKSLSYTQQAMNSVLGATANAVGGGDLTKSMNQIGGSAINIMVDKINTSLTLDNLENSPDILKNANGNVILNIMVSGVGLIYELYEALPSELEEANDYMVQYGYTYNHIDKLSNVDNIRKRFNYIEADVESITAPISNIEKERLRDILRSVRFWNSDNVNYDYENYERWLENYV